MTSRKRMQIALGGGKPDVVPTFLCYHSMYLNRHTTLEYLAEYQRRMGDAPSYLVSAREDLEIRRQVIKWTLDLFAGRVDFQFGFPNIPPLECETITRRYIDLSVQYIDTDDVRIVDRGDGARVEGIAPHGNWNRGAKLDTKADVNKYFEPKAPAPSAAQDDRKTEEDPYAGLRDRHRRAVAESYRVGSFTTPFASAVGAFSYEGAMVAIHDNPKVFRYFIERATEARLERIRSATAVDGFWFDEYYTDVISPDDYKQYVFEPNRKLASAVRQSGKQCMYYFCGDIMPKLDMALDLEVDAIAFEESKKWFRLDVAEIRKRVGNRKALVGNMDGLHLLPRGRPEEIEAEVKRQLAAAARDGGFVMGAGSPIAPDTPAENMAAFLEASRRFGVYPIGR